MNLRSYQRDQCIAVHRELATHRSTLVVSATGTGKSFTLSVCAEVHLRRGGRRVLVLAPRDELLAQQKKTFLRAIPRLREIDIAVEKAEQRAAAGTPVVLASPQSLYGERLRSAFKPNEFSMVIVDEAHLQGRLLEAVIHYFTDAKVVGFTATPDRLDGKPLVPFPYESIAHVYELPDAIEQGYLSPLMFEQARVEGLDLSAIPVSNRRADFTDEELDAALSKEAVIASASAVIRDRCFGLKTLVFMPGVKSGDALAEALGPVARSVSGETPQGQRREIVEAFRKGEFGVLVNCMLLVFGFDVPDLECVVLGRPTKSRALMSQQVGRVTRRSPGKEYGLVLDLVGNVGRHKLVTPKEALRPSGWPYRMPPIEGEILKTEFEEEEDAAAEEAERTLAEIDSDTIRQLASTATVSTRSVDPELAIFGLDIPAREQNARNATTAQIEALRRAGIANPDFLSFDQAQALFEALEDRRAAGLCTLKMGRLLARKGLSPNASFEKAEWAITKIKGNRWRTPPEVVTDRELRYGGSATLKLKQPAAAPAEEKP